MTECQIKIEGTEGGQKTREEASPDQTSENFEEFFSSVAHTQNFGNFY